MKRRKSQISIRSSLMTAFVIAFAGILLIATPALAENHSGTIGTETWTFVNSPHIITGDVTVSDGHTLTIEAGCEVKFDGNYYLLISGRLIADGDSSNHITFTSNQSVPGPGDWYYIGTWSSDPGTLLDYCDISYGGSSGSMIAGGFHGGNVTISNSTIEYSANRGISIYTNSSLYLNNCTIQNNDSYGVYCDETSANAMITDCIIQNNGNYAVRTYADNIADITGNTIITGNTPNAIWVGPENMYSGTWENHGADYIITGNVSLINGHTLTIEPGNTIKFDGNYYFHTNGTLIADGDSLNHITFTSNQLPPNPGDWQYLSLSSADAGTIVDYCDIFYAGSSAGNIYVAYTGTDVTISNCVIDSGGTNGIYLGTNTTPTITDCIIQNCTGAGVYCSESSANIIISDCVIHNNGSYPIVCYGNDVNNITGTMSLMGNNPDAIWVGSESMNTGTWLNHGVPYIIGGDLTVNDAEILTINPGIDIKFDGNYYFRTNGKLLAEGSARAHITFTSNQPAPNNGDWQYLMFWNSDTGTIMDYCDVSYGGSGAGSIYIGFAGSSVTVSNCNITNSANDGIRIYTNTSPTISDCYIHDNNGSGIHSADHSANPIINNCIIENNNHGYYAVGGCHPEFTYNNQIINNTNYGIYLGGSSIATFGASLSQWNDIYGNGSYELYNGTDSTYATYIYWGTTDPEGISIEIYDHNDDPLLGYVKFYPYLNATHDVEYPEEISAPENVIIYIESDSVHLQWNSVNGANFYKVYLLDNPYSTIPADSTVVTDTTWTAPVSGEKKFYYIKAVK